MAVRAHDLQMPFEGAAIVYKFPGAQNKRARTRVATAKNQGALFLIAIAAVLGLTAGSWQGTSSAASVRSTPEGARVVVVQVGDTLWSIASENVPEDMDVRSYMNEILALNGRVAAVAPGWRLKLPR